MAPLQSSLVDTRCGTALPWTEMEVLPLKLQGGKSQTLLSLKRHQYSAQMFMQGLLTSHKMWEDHCFSEAVVPFGHFFNPILEMF